MYRTPSWWMMAVVAGATCVWWTGLRADDEAAVAPPSSQITDLLARTEKLERRVEALEAKSIAPPIQQTHVVATADEWVSPAHPAPQTSQPQFGIVYSLKRIVPEAPVQKPEMRDGKPVYRFGGVEFNR